MAYELHGLLAGNVSVVTGENIKPSYGGDDEAFLKKVISPIYRVIEKVCFVDKIQMNLIHYTLNKQLVMVFSRKLIRAVMEKPLIQLGAIMTI